MKQIRLKEMFDCGCHLGSNIKNLNPKMRPYVMSVHDGIAIIDILKTYTRLFRISLFLKKVMATQGYGILFVGTQKSIAPIIASIASKSSSPYINERWKGGFLTNFKTLQKNEKSHLSSEAKSEPYRLPDIVIIVGQNKEMKAVKECQKLNIPTISILDSDGDPSLTNLFIPANDDSASSVECILKHLGQAVLLGRYLYDQNRQNNSGRSRATLPRRKKNSKALAK